MKVDVQDQHFTVAFHNISERIVHDLAPDYVRNIYVKQLNRDDLLPEDVELYDALRRYTRLRAPRCVSLITTECIIRDAATNLIEAKGFSYYSKSEVLDGKPFSRLTARAKSLKRALGDTAIDHREGRAFTQDEKAAFWQAFKDWQVKVTRAKGQASSTELRMSSSAGEVFPPTSA